MLQGIYLHCEYQLSFLLLKTNKQNYFRKENKVIELAKESKPIPLLMPNLSSCGYHC